jgi:hypothetical protein
MFDKKLTNWIPEHKDSNLATCILDMRQLGALTSGEVQKLHDFLWVKQCEAAAHFKI